MTGPPASADESGTQSGFEEHQVEFHNEGVKLAGSLLLPRSVEPIAAVVFVHGAGRQTREPYRELGEYFASQGNLPVPSTVVNFKRAIGALNLLILIALTITVFLAIDQMRPSCPAGLIFLPLLGTVSTLATIALLILLIRARGSLVDSVGGRIRGSLDVLCLILFVPYMVYWNVVGVGF